MKPDFLYIGVPRAGSTWLWRNLQQHPDIWMPPFKHINYFHPRFQKMRLKRLKYHTKEIFWDHTDAPPSWYLKFFAKPTPDDAWYEGLFPDDQALVKGEIAEDYAVLEEEDIARIHALMPDCKIFIILRNPVDRTISNARHAFMNRKGIPLEDVSEAALLAHIDHPDSVARSNYVSMLKRWRRFFDEEQLLIRFYEDISDKPLGLLEDICVHIGADFEKTYFEESAPKRVLKTKPDNLSVAIQKHIAAKHMDEVEALAETLGSHAASWREDMRALLK